MELAPGAAGSMCNAQRSRAAMKIVAVLIKDEQVIDTYTFEIPTRDHLAEAAKKAFAYFRDRYPHMTTTANDVMIAFRDDEDIARENGS
jgi:hypothetical protein